MPHEAWVKETLQSNVLFDAALRNVAARFAPEKLNQRLNEGQAFKGAAGLERERVAFNSKDAFTDHQFHSPRKEARPYPNSGSVANDVIYNRGPEQRRAPPYRPPGSAGMPCTEESAQVLGKQIRPGDAAPKPTLDAVHFGAAPLTEAPALTTRECRQMLQPATPSSLKAREPCPYHTDAPNEPEAALIGERSTPRQTSLHLNPTAMAEVIAMQEGNGQDLQRPGGVRMLGEQQRTPRQPSRKAIGSCNPVVVSTPPRPVSARAPGERFGASSDFDSNFSNTAELSGRFVNGSFTPSAPDLNEGFLNTGEVAMRRSGQAVSKELRSSASHGYAGLHSTRVCRVLSAFRRTCSASPGALKPGPLVPTDRGTYIDCRERACNNTATASSAQPFASGQLRGVRRDARQGKECDAARLQRATGGGGGGRTRRRRAAGPRRAAPWDGPCGYAQRRTRE